jgi:hypothetical protein
METFILSIASLCMATGFTLSLHAILNPVETRHER